MGERCLSILNEEEDVRSIETNASYNELARLEEEFGETTDEGIKGVVFLNVVDQI